MNPFMKRIARTFALTLLCSHAAAEPTSDPVSITALRPYSGGNTVYVYTTGNFCSSAFYSIDLGSNAGKAMYAAALTAIAAAKTVRLEAAGTCGAGPAGSTLLQSIYINQ